MKRRHIAKLTTLLLAMAWIGCSSMPDAAPVAREHEPLVVFLVRHAEKVEGGKDPMLSVAGTERAAALSLLLRDAEIEHVHSSDYIRTRDTAAPVLGTQGLELELYDPRDLPGFADKLREMGGRHLVVGHSNTTPQLVELLGGSPGTEIDEAGEYDRLYVVTIGRDGTVSSALLRYGDVHASATPK